MLMKEICAICAMRTTPLAYLACDPFRPQIDAGAYYGCTSFIRYGALVLCPQHFDNQSGHSTKVLLVFRTGEDAETCGSRGRGDGDIVLRDICPPCISSANISA